MNDFMKRFRALLYDHPWQMFPYYFGYFFLILATVQWISHKLFDWELWSFLELLAFSGALALMLFIKDRIREARSRR